MNKFLLYLISFNITFTKIPKKNILLFAVVSDLLFLIDKMIKDANTKPNMYFTFSQKQSKGKICLSSAWQQFESPKNLKYIR